MGKYFKYVFVFIFLQASIKVFASNHCAEIIQVTGKVDVLRIQQNESERIAIPVKAPFNTVCTDIVVTRVGSRAKIKFGDSTITMSPNSRLALNHAIKQTNTPGLINLTFGKIRTFFDSKDAKAKADKQTKFRVRTPTAVVGVRGTDFYVSFDPNKDITTQATLVGEVQVEQLGSGQKVVVNGGQQVDVVKIEKEDVKKIVKIKKEIKDQEEQSGEVIFSETESSGFKLTQVIDSLKVVPIKTETIVEIRQTSVLVKVDKEFTSENAVKILGAPEKWEPLKNEIPGDLKDIKNVF